MVDRGAFLSALAVTLVCCACSEPLAQPVTYQDAQRACGNWLAYCVHEAGSWAGAQDPTAAGVETLAVLPGVAAWCFHISPSGYVIIPPFQELLPIQAYSDNSSLTLNAPEGFAALLRSAIGGRVAWVAARYESGSFTPRNEFEAQCAERQRRVWSPCLQQPAAFARFLRTGMAPPRTGVGPLLTTEWNQTAPYNDMCPLGTNGVRCVPGCVTVAVAQILNYHRCPLAGVGNHTDNWAGDTCGTGTPGTPLTVDLSDAYDWDSMPLACNPPQNCTEEEKAALSELIYEIAVVFDAQFQSCSPGTYAALDPVGLDAHFMYECALGINQRNWYSEEEWFNLIRDELDESRPIYYTYSSPAGSHALVCDGWRQDLVGDQIHLNYGWGSAHDNWYYVDAIYPPGPLIEVIRRGITPTLLVRPDGAGCYPTIQAALDAAEDGETVTLADGVYTGPGNRDVVLVGKTITLESASGDPSLCILDCDSSGRGLAVHLSEEGSLTLRGLTIENGVASWGGALECVGGALTLERCVLQGNHAAVGGAVSTLGTALVIENCTVGDNGAQMGGGLACVGGVAAIDECVVVGNTAEMCGGGVLVQSGRAYLEGCRIEGNECDLGRGGGIACVDASVLCYGCSLLDNTARLNGGGAWGGSEFVECDTCETLLNGWMQEEGYIEGEHGEGGNGLSLEMCDLRGNLAMGTMGGGAICVEAMAEPAEVDWCTCDGNAALLGSGFGCSGGASLLGSHSIVVYGSGCAVACSGGGSISLACTDVYGNQGGDWTGCIEQQAGVNGNINADPQFCGEYRPDFPWMVFDSSPCASGNSHGCYQIGAWGVGCGPSAAGERSDVAGTNTTLRVVPSPEQGNVRIEVLGSRPWSHPLRLRIYDSAGRAIRQLQASPRGGGLLVWDGTDADGRAVASGRYYVRAVVDGRAVARPFVLVR